AKRPVSDALERRVEQPAERHRADERQAEPPDDLETGARRVEAELLHPDVQRHPASEHEDVAVREVDQLEDAVDEGVAERDQRVEGAEREADQEDLDEVGRRLVEVDAEPGEEERDEGKADDGGDAWPVASASRQRLPT